MKHRRLFAAVQGRVTANCGNFFTQRASLHVPGVPTLGSAPLNQRALQIQCRCLRNTQAPQRRFALNRRVTQLGEAVPGAVLDHGSGHLARRRSNRTGGACEANIGLAIGPSGGRNRQRLPGPLVELLHGLLGGTFKLVGRDRLGLRQDL